MKTIGMGLLHCKGSFNFWILVQLDCAEDSIGKEGMNIAQGMHSAPKMASMVDKGVTKAAMQNSTYVSWFRLEMRPEYWFDDIRFFSWALVKGTLALSSTVGNAMRRVFV